VKIRCRSRRTSPSTRRQSTAPQSRTSPSGPFTVTVSNLPIGSSVSVHLFFTGSPDPRQLPFGPGNTPVSDQLCGIHPAEVPATRFPVSCRRFGCRPSLLGSSCARWGVAPSSRSAYRRRSAGPQRGCRVAHEQDPNRTGRPLDPGDGGALPTGDYPSAGTCRSAAASPYTPLEHPIGVVNLHETSSRVHSRSPITPRRLAAALGAGKRHRFPPVFSSPATTGWNGGRFGFDPGLRTPRSPAEHAGAETGLRALARVLHLRHQSNLQTVPPTSLMHPHVAPTRRSPRAPPPATRRHGTSHQPAPHGR
jgi:hypothetical protein